MNKNTYRIISKFECCVTAMVAVIMNGSVVYVMP